MDRLGGGGRCRHRRVSPRELTGQEFPGAKEGSHGLAERFFYHSFPQRSERNEALEKGLAILDSIATSGFLLTPGITEWREPREGGLSDPVRLASKSISFTELEPGELSRHSERYGPFAIQFPIRKLLALGALPVIYLPPARAQRQGLEGVGSTFLFRVGEIQGLLERLVTIEALDQDDRLLVVHDGDETTETTITVGAAKELIEVLGRRHQPVQQLLNALRAFLSLVHITEDMEGEDDELKHYREREWRIVSGIAAQESDTTRDLTDEEKDRLIALDRDFFSYVQEFPTGPRRRVDQCRMMERLENEPVLSYASRVIVPADAATNAASSLEAAGLSLQVISQEEFQ